MSQTSSDNTRRVQTHEKNSGETVRRLGIIIVNLSKDVFERRTSTGSGFFSFLDSGFAHFLGQLVSIIVKTLRNTNLGASRCFKMKKTSLPVDVRRSKTPLLKLPNSGALARSKCARSGAPWVTKFGKLSIREDLVMT